MAKRTAINIEPVTRLEGHMGVHAEADLEAKKYVDAHCYATMFRGLEDILVGHEPADAIWIAQRSCGVCPTPHATASVMAVEMAYNAPPPPLGITLRNLAYMAEEVYDGALGCGILEGPDYSEAIIAEMNPQIMEQADKEPAAHQAQHGYTTIGDIMRSLNPITGSFWLKCLEASKIGLSMGSIMGAKLPHQNNFVPGGIARTINLNDLESYYGLLAREIAFTKELTSLFDDLLDFLNRHGLEKVGVLPLNMLSWGMYDDPFTYDAKYANMPRWGEKRLMPPGVIIDGKLITSDLIEMQVGVQETVTHSYYDETARAEFANDPAGNPLTKDHPWNESTKPHPGPAMNWEGKYTWAKTPRWLDWKKRVDGKTHVLLANPISRMWVAALSQKRPEYTGSSIKFTLPASAVAGYLCPDEVTLEWRLPKYNSALERVRARAYFHALSAYYAYHTFAHALEMIKNGETKVWNEYKRPSAGLGVGVTEAMRGGVAHWVVMKSGKISRYQIITPTAWNVSPRDAEGRPGPFEAAIIGSPITEPANGKLHGIDVVRILHSCDPCLGCTVQVFNPQQTLLAEREIDHLHGEEVLDQCCHTQHNHIHND